LIDTRAKRLAGIIVGYSTAVKQGDRVSINIGDDVPSDFVCLLVEKIAEAGGIPFVNISRARISRTLTIHASEEQLKLLCERDLAFMKEMQCYISIGGGVNNCEFADVPTDKTQLTRTHYGTYLLDYRVNNTRWVSMQWPTASIAQLASMSSEQFEDFYFDVCNLDYSKMASAAAFLVERMKRTDMVRIIGPKDTDIKFSIKGMEVVPCTGNYNLPDGEVFTAPIKESTEGIIHYNVTTSCHGKPCDDVRLVFKEGKIIEATGSDTKGINEVLDADEGARYVGEFAIGINPNITTPMRNTLFDEKIAGSIHLTPGMCYDMASNGNKSKIHWDMVLIQRADYGGGEMYFDDELIRRDGLFVPDYLKCLNPENLV
jgi:aminopeptidase